MIVILNNNYLINNGLQHILNKLFISAKIQIIEDFNKIEEMLPVTEKIICDYENLDKLYAFKHNIDNIKFMIVDNSQNTEHDYEFISINAPKDEIIEKLQNFCNDSDSNQYYQLITEREKEIIQLVATGLTNKEIANKLFISIHTVITHRKNISAKLGIKTISGLTTYAILNGLVKIENIK